jgi:hypothetical protein
MSHYGSINGEPSSADTASGLLRVAAPVYRVTAGEVSDLLTKIRGTYRVLDQLRTERRVPDMFDLPPSWVVNRWLAALVSKATIRHLGPPRQRPRRRVREGLARVLRAVPAVRDRRRGGRCRRLRHRPGGPVGAKKGVPLPGVCGLLVC